MSKNKLDNSWNSFNEFIKVANEHCNWLVLRNFEYLPNNFFNNDKDVDVLCEDLDSFVKTMKLQKRSWGIGAYEAKIENKIVAFDVRFLGDGYYDKLWQYKMLENKIYTKDHVPCMDNEDYFYSLLYHCKIQKKEVKKIYIERLHVLAKMINILDYKKNSILDDPYIANLLSKFMKKNFYIYTKPIDVNVPKNNNFFKYLDISVQKEMSYKIPIIAKVSKYIPNFLFKLISPNIKSNIKKIFSYDI